MCCLGLVVVVLGLSLYVTSFLRDIGKNISVGGMAQIAGGIVGALGGAIFIVKAKTDLCEDVRFSAPLSIAGCALIIVSGGLQLLAHPSDYNDI